MAKKWFYGVMGVVVSVLLCRAAIMTIAGMEEDTSGYPSMTIAEREAGLKEIRREIEDPAGDPKVYFETLAKLDHLMRAAKKAESRGDVRSIRGRGDGQGTMDPVALQFMMNDYVMRVQAKMKIDENFVEAKEAHERNNPVSYAKKVPMDPAVPKMWATFYGMLILLTLGHFWLRIRDLGGNFAMMVVDPRFAFWLALCPVGIFRYPTPVDVRSAALRAYRLAALALSSLITIAAAGCGGKKVKTGAEEERVESPHTLHVDFSTKAWPAYMGSNGAIFHPDPVAQTAVVASRSGGYAGAWFSVPVTKTSIVPNYGYEVDLFGGWSGTMAGMNVDFGVTFIGVTPIRRYQGDALMFSALASRDVDVGFGKISPYFHFQQASPVRGVAPAAGFFLREGVRWSGQRGRISGRANVELVRDSGAFGFQSGYLAQAGAEVSIKVGQWSVGMPIRFSEPVTKNIGDRKRELQVGIGLTRRIR